MSFSFLQCPLRVKKFIQENSAESFTSAQNLEPPFLCQYLIFFNDLFFYFRDFIWKFEENCRSEGKR